MEAVVRAEMILNRALGDLEAVTNVPWTGLMDFFPEQFDLKEKQT